MPSASVESARSDVDGLRGFAWEELLDGKLRALTRGVHYSVSTKVLEQRARGAARLLGRVAVTSADRLGHRESMWVQFLDGEVEPGRPCPHCGGRRLERLQVYFARCCDCRAIHRLAVSGRAERDAGVAKAIERGKYRLEYDERYLLTDYEQAVFFARSADFDHEVLYGTAIDPQGTAVLLWARYPLGRAGRGGSAGERVRLWRIARWPVAPFQRFIDLARLPHGPDAFRGKPPLKHPDRLNGHLEAYTEVRFLHTELLPARERFFGHALADDGSPALICVDFPLIGGQRVTDQEDPQTDFHAAYAWPLRPFADAIDLHSLVAASG